MKRREQRGKREIPLSGELLNERALYNYSYLPVGSEPCGKGKGGDGELEPIARDDIDIYIHISTERSCAPVEAC